VVCVWFFLFLLVFLCFFGVLGWFGSVCYFVFVLVGVVCWCVVWGGFEVGWLGVVVLWWGLWLFVGCVVGVGWVGVGVGVVVVVVFVVVGFGGGVVLGVCGVGVGVWVRRS
ncbi:hypothetical protein, partial [Pseudomonas syringae group genomosp. 7]|uniref:hypothetical protein n=1 Tax=Pseudomonas syringae group genomosp. 7 TaxID=251699 RepID=UPI0037706DDA